MEKKLTLGTSRTRNPGAVDTADGRAPDRSVLLQSSNALNH